MNWMEARRQAREIAKWRERGYAAPSPAFVKREVLSRHNLPDATWIETGTFQGDTTAFLAGHAKKVISIEPEPKLYAAAVERFKGNSKVELHNGLSETVMPACCRSCPQRLLLARRSLLLRHHAQGAEGHADHRGAVQHCGCDRRMEQGHGAGRRRALLRPERPDYPDYPDRSFLTHWAEKLGLTWMIEHDIFIAKKA